MYIFNDAMRRSNPGEFLGSIPSASLDHDKGDLPGAPTELPPLSITLGIELEFVLAVICFRK